MNAVELVKQICKERGISIAKLERDCDFSNGYIGKIKKGVFPVDKAQSHDFGHFSSLVNEFGSRFGSRFFLYNLLRRRK